MVHDRTPGQPDISLFHLWYWKFKSHKTSSHTDQPIQLPIYKVATAAVPLNILPPMSFGHCDLVDVHTEDVATTESGLWQGPLNKLL